MANINKITLPNGDSYDIEDTVARQMDLSATFTETSVGSGIGDLELIFESAGDSDDEEF